MENKIKENKNIIIIGAVILVIVGGLFLFSNNSNVNDTDYNESTPAPTIATEETELGSDPLNATYNIQGQNIKLINGENTEQIPNSSTVISTQNFNEPIIGDLNDLPNDPEDASFIIVQDPGGSGTFYYVVASIASANGYYGTNGILLGDRVAIQSQEITDDGTIIVNYADRPEDASMTEQPSEAVSKYFRIDGANLIEVDNPNL